MKLSSFQQRTGVTDLAFLCRSCEDFSLQTESLMGFHARWKSLSPVRLCDPMAFAVHGILQARILDWVAFPFSRESSQPRDQTQVSHIAGRFFTSWATREAQEYWSGWPIPSPGIFPIQELNQGLLHCRRVLYQLSYQGSRGLGYWVGIQRSLSGSRN